MTKAWTSSEAEKVWVNNLSNLPTSELEERKRELQERLSEMSPPTQEKIENTISLIDKALENKNR